MPFNQQGQLPPTAAPGQQYGQRTQQIEAQQQVPMAPPPPTPAVESPPVTGGPEPGGFGPLGAPSGRPEEPVTAGSPIGAGPGPEVLQSSPHTRGGDLLRMAAEQTRDPFLVALMDRMRR